MVYLSPPKPMYECTTPEGETYTSDTGDGNPRWVSYGLPYPAYPAWPRSGGPARPERRPCPGAGLPVTGQGKPARRGKKEAPHGAGPSEPSSLKE